MKVPMKVLVLGSNGQLGFELMRADWAPGTDVVGLPYPEFDVTRPGDVVTHGALVGPATSLYPGELPGTPLDLDVAVLARLAMARLARGLDLPTHPLYLRRPDVHVGVRRAT